MSSALGASEFQGGRQRLDGGIALGHRCLEIGRRGQQCAQHQRGHAGDFGHSQEPDHGAGQRLGLVAVRRVAAGRQDQQPGVRHTRRDAFDLGKGTVDVVVTDGFSGNIALKAIEGTARFVADLLRRSFASSLRSKIGFLISRPATELLKHHLDPNNHNGAVFLGLNGIVVKSHGSASALGVANAVAVTARLLEEKLTERIQAELEHFGAESIRSGGKAAG